MIRQIGQRIFQGTPVEPIAYRLYERSYSVFKTGKPSLGGYYEVDIEELDTPPFEMWLEKRGVLQADKFSGIYEEEVVNLLNDILDKNSDLWVIGGGNGYHSLAFAPLVKHITTFEANPTRADRIDEAIHRNGVENIDLVSGYVGDDVDLNDYDIPDVALMDIDGMEYDILSGANGLLRNDITWVIELHTSDAPGVDGHADPEGVIKILREADYDVKQISQRRPSNYHVIATK